MSSLTDEMTDQVNEGRKAIVHKVDELRNAIDGMDMSRGRLLIGGAAIAAAAIGIGVIVYRRTRRRTLAQRVQDALPDSLRGQLKRPLQRAAQAL